ncbi:MAG: hypothetical protein ACLVAW_18170 [Eisenbergiella massiliensis]
MDRWLLGLSGKAGFQAGIQEQGEDSQGKAGGQGGGNGKTPGKGAVAVSAEPGWCAKL